MFGFSKFLFVVTITMSFFLGPQVKAMDCGFEFLTVFNKPGVGAVKKSSNSDAAGFELRTPAKSYADLRREFLASAPIILDTSGTKAVERNPALVEFSRLRSLVTERERLTREIEELAKGNPPDGGQINRREFMAGKTRSGVASQELAAINRVMGEIWEGLDPRKSEDCAIARRRAGTKVVQSTSGKELQEAKAELAKVILVQSHAQTLEKMWAGAGKVTDRSFNWAAYFPELGQKPFKIERTPPENILPLSVLDGMEFTTEQKTTKLSPIIEAPIRWFRNAQAKADQALVDARQPASGSKTKPRDQTKVDWESVVTLPLVWFRWAQARADQARVDAGGGSKKAPRTLNNGAYNGIPPVTNQKPPARDGSQNFQKGAPRPRQGRREPRGFGPRSENRGGRN